MLVVSDLQQVQENIIELERGKVSSESIDIKEYQSLIGRGTCFVPYSSSKGLAFAPSRFIGYVGNRLRTHSLNSERHGGQTNTALNKIFGISPVPNESLERTYLAFCKRLDITVSRQFERKRKYWITPEVMEYLDAKAERDIVKNSSINETEKIQLVKARIGQGLFRERVLSFWKHCCLTGCSFSSVLRASHIKPWRDADNEERLDVFNGLLLTPNMDALFDKGFISFEDSGGIIISPKITMDSQRALGLHSDMQIRFEKAHLKYLSWHRTHVFVNAKE
ncbi:HNH endonuclease [Thiospirillum jenense]|uniref:HNH endonuclease n=1 Tax=Thiospirillum jenense TaxID=1653858 RepID=A0A839HKD1_9GAMM|nr:HNH endonuclease [Thiospirillum jenense]MBB1126332.1 HNH endonuclease [Thiospirillum jenense]